ncbi:MAG TPA: HAMP domain-containing sensor histidine kinase, partial [Ramlibacter sp.]
RRQVSFLATVAHELRSPLMPLRLATLMLDRARTDESVYAQMQKTITTQVAQIARLIGDLLDGSRISTGNYRLERTMVDIDTVLRRSIETCAPALDTRNHRLAYEPPAAPTIVLADEARLVQVFCNLVENSAKYTPEGGAIAVRVSRQAGAAVVAVSDNGIGIAASVLPHVFNMFVRDANACAFHEGLGIGLSVVRDLVKAHEGSVVATSRGANCGSEFTVTLPLATVNPVARPAA